MFITFCQNNSGGYFIQNEDVDEYVIIEGNNLEEILDKANVIFEDYREYCDCCGERWDDDLMDEEDLDESPMIYDKSAYKFKDGYSDDSKAMNGEKEVLETR